MSFFQASPNAELDPSVYAAYQAQRRGIDNVYKSNLAENQHTRNQLGVQRADTLRDLTNQFARQRRTLSQGMGARGLANSGIWQRRVADFQQDRNQAFSGLNTTYSDQLARLALARQQLEATRNSQIADIDMHEAARRAELATMLRNNLQGFI